MHHVHFSFAFLVPLWPRCSGLYSALDQKREHHIKFDMKRGNGTSKVVAIATMSILHLTTIVELAAWSQLNFLPYFRRVASSNVLTVTVTRSPLCNFASARDQSIWLIGQ